MKRAFILVLDSFGIGALPDADKFGDAGANTLRHIAECCMSGKGDEKGYPSSGDGPGDCYSNMGEYPIYMISGVEHENIEISSGCNHAKFRY